jgi:5-methylcytosine-specific restriction enzyme B
MSSGKRNKLKPTEQTAEVLRLYDQGQTDKEIAKRLDLPVASVRARLAHKTMGTYAEYGADKAAKPETENRSPFTWIPIYAELAKRILQFRNRQPELINIMKELKADGLLVISIVDHDQEKTEIPLEVIDPFTFFANFNRALKKENRQSILASLKTKFALESEIPVDFDGLPVVPLFAAWFFPWAATRKADDIPSLWALAEGVVASPPEKLDPKLFERCLQIETVGPPKLTMGMFWLNPEHYIAWDKNNQNLFRRNGISIEVENFATYLQLMKDVNANLGTNYPEISRTAFNLPPDKQYWAGGFQWGETSKLEEFMHGNFWRIGWKKEDPGRAAKKTWAYFDDVNVGDEFAIKGYGGRNDLRIHYIGKVVAKSEEDGILRLEKLDRPLYRDKGPEGLTGTTWFDTLVPIKSKTIIDEIFHSEQPGPEPRNESCSINLILYGPPGTGKTYQTVERAVQIIAPSFYAEHQNDHNAHKQKFDELMHQGRIEFTTFHQSYSYEDFVEGIRPVMGTEGETDEPRYECRAGIFKRLAGNALFDCLETIETVNHLVSFDVLWRALFSKIESEPDTKYPGLTEKTSYQLIVTPRGNIEGNNVITGKSFFCSRKILEQVFDAKRSQDSVSAADVMEVVMRGCHSHFVAAVFNELKRMEKSQLLGKVQQPREVTYTFEEKMDKVQRFVTESEASGYRLKSEPEWNRYVLVIDEINRGNISKILGELITLLEEDKRLHRQNSLVVTLPYSGEKFAVPANLYILATMNTADKSIALVDLALRRRFDFDEVPVNLDVCQGLSDKMKSVLLKLNQRIALRKDRDHQIGHAYFIKVKDDETFNQRFRSQIIPLLQEYFYNDWEGLRYVLGENLNSSRGFIRKLDGADAPEARTKWQWFFNAGADDLNCLQTLLDNYTII